MCRAPEENRAQPDHRCLPRPHREVAGHPHGEHRQPISRCSASSRSARRRRKTARCTAASAVSGAIVISPPPPVLPLQRGVQQHREILRGDPGLLGPRRSSLEEHCWRPPRESGGELDQLQPVHRGTRRTARASVDSCAATTRSGARLRRRPAAGPSWPAPGPGSADVRQSRRPRRPHRPAPGLVTATMVTGCDQPPAADAG
jgi:hypothetical protein